MDQSTTASFVSQIAAAESHESFRDTVRAVCRQALLELMYQEVDELCGRRHAPDKKSGYRRAGSAPGLIYIDNSREDVTRPRVRKLDGDCGETEYNLKSYEACQDNEDIIDKVITAYASGTSTRSAGEIFPDVSGVSSSEVSRLWAKRSAELLVELRERSLDREEYVAVYVDGVFLARELVFIAAMGVTASGDKRVLDFESGSSENHLVCKELMSRLQTRGVKFCGRPLFIIDGGNALKKGIKSVYPSALIQRCLVHLERNVRAYLSYKHYAKIAELFKKIRLAQGSEDGRRALMALRKFLRKTNHQAWQCVRNAGADAIAVHLLNIPNSMNVSLLSTNNIENIFGTARKKLARVKKWNTVSDMSSRWMAYVLLEAEKGFRKISGYRQLPDLISSLKKAEKTKS